MVLLFGLWLGIVRETAQAAASLNLAVQPAAQRLVTPVNGDAGLWDCLPASIYMALRYLEQRNGGAAIGYESVRAAFRAGVAADSPISPLLAPSLVTGLSGGAVSASVSFTNSSAWESWLAAELKAGSPVIPFIDNWLLLSPADHPTAEAGLSQPEAHAVVISGLHNGNVIYEDPWDGAAHSLPVAEFASAWSASWGATVFHAVR